MPGTFASPKAALKRSFASRKPKRWQLQDAKARLSRLVKDAQTEGPQIITLRGEEVAVVQSVKDYEKGRRSNSDEGPNIFEVLLKCPPGPPLVMDRDPSDVVGALAPNIFD
jgi:prevent-host-death family protein